MAQRYIRIEYSMHQYGQNIFPSCPPWCISYLDNSIAPAENPSQYTDVSYGSNLAVQVTGVQHILNPSAASVNYPFAAPARYNVTHTWNVDQIMDDGPNHATHLGSLGAYQDPHGNTFEVPPSIDVNVCSFNTQVRIQTFQQDIVEERQLTRMLLR